MGRMAAGLARAGIDTRVWSCRATVATIHGDEGAANYDDQGAVVISPSGVDVDVILEPYGWPITCRYPGIQAGEVSILAPIRPGDQVLVSIPDGDLAAIPEIVKVIPDASGRALPTETDGKPVFRNDRLSIFARSVPIEIRTGGGGHLRINTDGTIQFGGTDVTEQLLLATTYRQNEGQMNQSLVAAISALNVAAAAMTPVDIAVITGLAATVGAFLTAFKVFAPLWLQAIQGFEAGSAQFLSQTVRTK